MLFFKKKATKKPSVRTQAMRLIGSALRRTVHCDACGRRASAAGKQPLSQFPCPKCSHPLLVPAQIADYWLYRYVAQGGMGVVYKAVSSNYPDEHFAIKLLPPGRDDETLLIETLHNEARMMQLFHDHPGVCSAVEFGLDNGHYFLATEFIHGDRLDHRVDRDGAMTEAAVVQMALSLVSVERFIIRSGYLYRDLKPENIILRSNDDSPVLVDFGLCQSVNDSNYGHEDEEVDGAPHFMPPERVIGNGERVYSEIYSLGMVMYYALTGQTFFESGDAQTVAEAYAFSDRSASILPFLSAVSDPIRDLIHKMIQPDPAQRCQSFERLETDLKATIRG